MVGEEGLLQLRPGLCGDRPCRRVALPPAPAQGRGLDSQAGSNHLNLLFRHQVCHPVPCPRGYYNKTPLTQSLDSCLPCPPGPLHTTWARIPDAGLRA